MTAEEPRSERIVIRTTPTTKALLQEAAASSHKSVSQFVLDAAEAALTGCPPIQLNDEQWQAFQDALDRPAVFNPRLARLMTGKSVGAPGRAR